LRPLGSIKAPSSVVYFDYEDAGIPCSAPARMLATGGSPFFFPHQGGNARWRVDG
jgi:hypothetical protein